MTEQVEKARIYFDVDGVLNAVTRKVPDWGWSQHRRTRIKGFPILWSPDLIDVLNGVAATPGLGIYWLTTWCHDAPGILAPALGLNGSGWPVVGYDHWRRSVGLPWWKHRAIVEHLDGFAGDVLWIDDDHGVDSGAMAWLAGQPQVLAMAPASGVGITRSEAATIQRFTAALAPPARPEHEEASHG